MNDTENSGIERIAVIGAGTMGRQIAALAASRSYPVTIYDAAPGAVERAQELLSEELPLVVLRYDWPATREFILKRIEPASTLADAVAGADLVIEAVRENLETKRSVFSEIAAAAPEAILATNSSSLPSAWIADAIPDATRLLNMHFFAPIWQRPMLEIMSSGTTDSAIIDACARWGRDLDLTVAVCQGQSMGFIINRIWRAVKRESLRVVDEGHASPEDVDRLWMRFFGSHFGPFGMMDTVGLDTVADIERSYVAVSTDPEDRVSTTLRALIERGDLGEKTGRGFYDHPNPAYRQRGFLTTGDGDNRET